MDNENPVSAAPAPTPSPFLDSAAPVLAAHPGVTREDKADLWDEFHNSKDPNELAAHLAPLAIPDDLKHNLFAAKVASTPKLAPIDKATAALQRLSEIPQSLLDLAEAHPKTTSLLVNAATQEEKAAAEPAGEPKTPRAPKGPKTEQVPAGLTPDVPTPPGHALIQTSDGALHHLPALNVPRARERDPQLKVLHVEP